MASLAEYVGTVHIHTTYSDGSGTVAEIAKAAARARLDFICIDDHNSLQARVDVQEGVMSGVLVIVGEEVNHMRNHYLAYRIAKLVPPDDDEPQAIIDAVARQGGVGFIAHPYESGSPYVLDGRTYPWTDWDATGFTGIEIWNMLSQWRDALTTLPRVLWYGIVRPGDALVGPSAKAVARWDDQAQVRRVVAIGGADVHALRLGWGPFRFTFDGYGYAFRCINMHILLAEATLDAALVVGALGRGQSFIALDLLGDARGFRFWGEGSAGRCEMGGAMAAGDCVAVRYELPARSARCRTRVLWNGREIAQSPRIHGSVEADRPGVYRAEVYRRVRGRWRVWILSNPIWLT